MHMRDALVTCVQETSEIESILPSCVPTHAGSDAGNRTESREDH